MPSIALVLAAALSAAAPGSPPTTPEELGAVTSAIAFTEMCSSLKDAPTEKDGATGEELAIAAIATELCKGMVVSAVATLGMADKFTLGGKEVCVPESLSVDAVIGEMTRQIGARRDAYEGHPLPDIQTPTAIVLAIQTLSTCKTGR